MKRRTLKQLRSRLESLDHHNVYVVLPYPAVGKLRKVRAENPKRDQKKPCVYIGMTGLTPEERFANHKAGIKDASLVKRYGLRLLPELYEHLNPMPFDAAAQMEKDLAEDLRRVGTRSQVDIECKLCPVRPLVREIALSRETVRLRSIIVRRDDRGVVCGGHQDNGGARHG